MCQYAWPGNVRELENWVHRQFLMCRGETIVHEDTAPEVPSPQPEPEACGCFAQAKAEAVRRFECDYLRRVLDQTGGNVTQAARLAGKERRAFGKLLKKHGIGSQDEAQI
jgi:DNA-binding NtrC family response regulator